MTGHHALQLKLLDPRFGEDWPLPATPTRLAAMASTPLPCSLACACAARSPVVSAAKPMTRRGRAGWDATAASTSAVRSNSSTSRSTPGAFFNLCADAAAGVQSATAAAPTYRSAGSAASTASCISRAERTSTRATPGGVGNETGPATSTTVAPRCAAAAAIANPILPLLRLPRNRTGSMSS